MRVGACLLVIYITKKKSNGVIHYKEKHFLLKFKGTTYFQLLGKNGCMQTGVSMGNLPKTNKL